jgi:hypothetical protein
MASRDPASPPDGARRTLVATKPASPVRAGGEPPVVARLVVEIRSDGTQTIARGAMEDAASGQKVAVEASGDNPLALALSLAKNITSAPWLARQAFRALMKR